jgi:dihydropteroate synthase
VTGSDIASDGPGVDGGAGAQRLVDLVGIVNRTRDSFYDKGATYQLDRAVAAVLRAEAEGASWIDLGGVPFGPGAPVSLDEEINRVVPLIREARRQTSMVISVDTTNAPVAEAALEAGADYINDTSGLSDPAMAGVIARASKGVVLVHSVSKPRVPVGHAEYRDVVSDVLDFLQVRVDRALDAGIDAERICVDPGHDLNKNTLHSLELTRRLEEFGVFGLPIFVAVSNKDFIGETLKAPIDQRITGTAATLAVCVMKGASLVRVHNVAEALQAVRMTEAILGRWQPDGLRHNI